MTFGRTPEDDDSKLRVEIRKLLAPVLDQISVAQQDIQSLQVIVTSDPGVFAEIQNILDNSHPEWSKAAYTTVAITPDAAGDDNLECYGWFRQPAADTTLVIGTANALKAEKTIEPADHTFWAANEGMDDDIPIWDKVNGPMEIGGATNAWDLFIQVPNDIVYPGQRFYFQIEAMLASGALPSGLQLYAGFWDNSAGVEKWVEGGSFTITGEIFGLAGATTVEYQVVAFTDSGEQAISNILTLNTAPATFSGSNHPRINFSGVPGFIRFDIYRKIGTNYVKQFTVGNSIDGTYYDIGNPPLAVVTGWPVVTQTKPRALATTTSFEPGSMSGLAWVRHDLIIRVPTTYDRSLTTPGSQFLRIGLSGVTASARQVLVRRIGLSMGAGIWARSANDSRAGAHSAPSTTAVGAGAGDPGGVGGGGGNCVLLGSTLELFGGSVVLGEARRGDIADSGGVVHGRLLYVKQAHASRVFHVTTLSGMAVTCTFDHPFITSQTDFTGTPLSALKERLDAGETVQTLTRRRAHGPIRLDTITDIEEELGDFFVGIPVMDGPHTVILNGFLCHNNKPPAGGGPDEF